MDTDNQAKIKAKTTKDIHDNYSGRLVVYSSDSDTDPDFENAQEGARELSPHLTPGTGKGFMPGAHGGRL